MARSIFHEALARSSRGVVMSAQHATSPEIVDRAQDVQPALQAAASACALEGQLIEPDHVTGVLIVQPEVDLATAFCWSEDLLASIPEFDGQVAIGLVSFDPDSCVHSMLTRAREAGSLAARRPDSSVCTWRMVQFRNALSKPDAQLSDHGQIVETVLAHWQEDVGPTQADHLITHSRYVSGMATRLGRAMGADHEFVERLRVAALCHDIGKLILPESVLAKSGALSAHEQRMLARHAMDGAEMALQMGIDEETADFIRHHHARFDAGNDAANGGRLVPVGAHVIAVADALVTMTSHRSYRPARSIDEAIRELQLERGRQFSPQVIDALPRAFLADADDHATRQAP